MDKKADLAGPGIGNCEDLEKILPTGYRSLLTPRETMQTLFAANNNIEANLCRELNLIMVQVPLIVDVQSGVNDYLDRDGSRTPIQSTSPTTTARTRSMPRLCRRRRSGSGSP